MTFERPGRCFSFQVPTGAPREYSEEAARSIDAEIQQLLEAAHMRVRETLTVQRALLESLGKLLIAHEVWIATRSCGCEGQRSPRRSRMRQWAKPARKRRERLSSHV